MRLLVAIRTDCGWPKVEVVTSSQPVFAGMGTLRCMRQNGEHSRDWIAKPDHRPSVSLPRCLE